MCVVCPNCGCNETKFIETQNLVHYGKEVCASCGRFIRWVPKPEYENVRRSTSKYDIRKVFRHHKFHEYGLDKPFCFFCLRTQDELGHNETLTLDHIVPLSEKRNPLGVKGKDELENLQILCTACHKLKNWISLYFNEHQKKRAR